MVLGVRKEMGAPERDGEVLAPVLKGLIQGRPNTGHSEFLGGKRHTQLSAVSSHLVLRTPYKERTQKTETHMRSFGQGHRTGGGGQD